MLRPKDSKERIDRRNLVSTLYVSMLAVIAYDHMIEPVRESIKESGIDFGILVLITIFFLTSMRFIIGNILHLSSDSLKKVDGIVWLYDFMFIVGETTLFIFLAEATSTIESLHSYFNFFHILLLIYLVDVFWVVSQWGLSRYFKTWKRKYIPWNWARLNFILVVFSLLIYKLAGSFYTNYALGFLGFANVLAFAIDVWVFDLPKLFEYS